MKCYDYALKYIYRFPKTEKELQIKLFQKWFTGRDVENTMKTLKKQKFVDDVMFTESYIRSEVLKKGKPTLLVSKKLEFKWVDKDIIKKILDKYEEDMQEWINEKIKKEIQAYKRKWVEWFDIIQKLMRKWYKLEDIKGVIKNRQN